MVEMLAGVPKIVLNVRSSVLIMQFLKIWQVDPIYVQMKFYSMM